MTRIVNAAEFFILIEERIALINEKDRMVLVHHAIGRGRTDAGCWQWSVHE